MKTRREVLNDVIGFREQPNNLSIALSRFPWDSAGEMVTLTRFDILRVLERFTRSQLSAADIEAWANLIEGREDIAYDPQYADAVQEAIYCLANPLLTQPLDGRLVDRLRQELGHS